VQQKRSSPGEGFRENGKVDPGGEDIEEDDHGKTLPPAEGNKFDTETIPGEERPEKAEGREFSSWRGWVISMLVAIILSVSATLLLSGSYWPKGAASAGGCGPGGKCSTATVAGSR